MEKKRWWRAGSFLLLTIVLVVAISASYGVYIYQKVEAETRDYMEELSKQSISLINERLSNDYLYLEGIAKSIGAQEKEIFAESILSVLQQRTETTRFTRLAVADVDGTVYYKDQVQNANVAERGYFQKALDGEATVECILDEAEDYREVVTAVPIMREQQIIGVMLGQYAMEKLQKLMDIDYFGGEGYVYIIRPDGEVLVKDERDTRESDNFNDLASDNANNITQNEISQIYAAMMSGENGAMSYKRGKTTYLLSFTAMGINDWFLLSIIPKEIINSQTMSIFYATVLYGISVLFVLGSSAVWTIRGWKKSHSTIQWAYKNIESIYRTVPGAVVCFEIDDACRIINANEDFYHTVGCTAEEFADKYDAKLLNVLTEKEKEWFNKAGDGLSSHEFHIQNARGREMWLLGNFDIQSIEGKRIAQAALVDVTSQHERITQAEMTARSDALTGLKNKRAVETEMEELLTESGGKGTLMVIDLDNFKQVNDTFGHLEGDRMLQNLADCIREVFRSDDFTGRIGGDEFIVFMKKVSKKDIAAKKAEQLIADFDAGLPDEVRKLGLSVSVGIALGPRDGRDYLELYQKADKALYAAKNHGRKCWQFWEE